MITKKNNNLWLEFGYSNIIKSGEELSGDNVQMKYLNEFTTIVLSDGLGSGVKANILSTLTSNILSTMISEDIDIIDCVETILLSLPIDTERGLAYSTFSLLYVNKTGFGYLLEFDNPEAIYIKNGIVVPLEREEFYIKDFKVFKSVINLDINDYIILLSDGVIHSGIGQTLPYGWRRSDLCKYIDEIIDLSMSPIRLATLITNKCKMISNNVAGDDITVVILKLRTRYPVNVFIGPPIDKKNDSKYVEDFLMSPGVKVVSGGTTANIIARYLNKEIKVDLKSFSREIPPIATIEGIDLITEGVVTYRKVLENSKKYISPLDLESKKYSLFDGASLLTDLLFEKATEITFFLGQSINYAHRGFPIEITLKLKLVEQLASNLMKIGKKVEIKYN
ncbi:MAG: serine/threonine-protein phosphatase [Acholeplasmatales bacterium]|jgi:hypothetical protein|nr:serine/threonine-protein phosphatase [Acholeplasmatales bacterium]